MPNIYTQIAYWSWAVLFLVWLPGYFTGKRTIRKPNPIRRAIAYILLIAGFMFLFSNSGSRNSFSERFLAVPHIFITPHTAAFGVLGVLIDLVAIIFAIWARITLGRNWSNAIALKENHELVKTGPYAIVRHPIYTGLLFAALGTALTSGRLTDYMGVALLLMAILIRIQDEDKLMAEQFPESHASYGPARRLLPRTKKLLIIVCIFYTYSEYLVYQPTFNSSKFRIEEFNKSGKEVFGSQFIVLKSSHLSSQRITLAKASIFC